MYIYLPCINICKLSICQNIIPSRFDSDRERAEIIANMQIPLQPRYLLDR